MPLNEEEKQWLSVMRDAANAAGHIYPDMAACEAALESRFGKSGLAVEAKNLFGMKQHKHPEYGTLSLPTKEFEHGEWVATTAEWVEYPDFPSCFEDRMATLKRLSSYYSEYADALEAVSVTEYIVDVSKKWSTDPNRARKVQDIWNEWNS